MSVATEPVLTFTADDIRDATPHRHPFALLDRVTAVVPGSHATGIKNITVSEPCFAGHFPQEYIYPGVLLVEVLGQLAGVVLGSTVRLTGVSVPMGYLAAIHSFKFVQPIRPGDQVILHARVGARVGTLTDFTVSAEVDGQTVASGRIAVGGVAVSLGGES